MDTVTWVVTVGLLYFLPTIFAWGRKHQLGMVAVINIFLGWTFIGWVVALAISLGDRGRDPGVTIGSG